MFFTFNLQGYLTLMLMLLLLFVKLLGLMQPLYIYINTVNVIITLALLYKSGSSNDTLREGGMVADHLVSSKPVLPVGHENVAETQVLYMMR